MQSTEENKSLEKEQSIVNKNQEIGKINKIKSIKSKNLQTSKKSRYHMPSQESKSNNLKNEEDEELDGIANQISITTPKQVLYRINDLTLLKIVIHALKKHNRNKNEIKVIQYYLSIFPKIEDVFNIRKSPIDPNEIYFKLSYVLKHEVFRQGQIICTNGEVGDKMYLIFKGKAAVLIPVQIESSLTEIEYLNYLLTLKRLKEYNLLSRVIKSNKHLGLLKRETEYLEFDEYNYFEMTSNELFTVEEYIERSIPKINVTQIEDVNKDLFYDLIKNVYPNGNKQFNIKFKVNIMDYLNKINEDKHDTENIGKENEDEEEEANDEVNINSNENSDLLNQIKKVRRKVTNLISSNNILLHIKEEEDSLDSKDSSISNEVKYVKEINIKGSKKNFKVVKIAGNMVDSSEDEDDLSEDTEKQLKNLNEKLMDKAEIKENEKNNDKIETIDEIENDKSKTKFKTIEATKELPNLAKKYIQDKVSNTAINSKISSKNHLMDKKYSLKKNNIYLRKYPLQIWTYMNVNELGPGAKFGEIAIANRNLKEIGYRTATIICTEKSIMASLPKKVYINCMSEIESRNRSIHVDYIICNKLFQDYPKEYFTSVYFNNFKYTRIGKGGVLFNQGEKPNSIFFLYRGELEVSMKSSLCTISKISSSMFNILANKSYKFKNEYYEKEAKNNYVNRLSNVYTKINEYFNRIRDITLYFINNSEIIGLDDFIFNGVYFSTVKCVSDKADLYVIDKDLFIQMIRKEIILRTNFSELMIEKLKMMKNRLDEYKNKTVLKYYETIVKSDIEAKQNEPLIAKNKYCCINNKLYKFNEVASKKKLINLNTTTNLINPSIRQYNCNVLKDCNLVTYFNNTSNATLTTNTNTKIKYPLLDKNVNQFALNDTSVESTSKFKLVNKENIVCVNKNNKMNMNVISEHSNRSKDSKIHGNTAKLKDVNIKSKKINHITTLNKKMYNNQFNNTIIIRNKDKHYSKTKENNIVDNTFSEFSKDQKSFISPFDSPKLNPISERSIGIDASIKNNIEEYKKYIPNFTDEGYVKGIDYFKDAKKVLYDAKRSPIPNDYIERNMVLNDVVTYIVNKNDILKDKNKQNFAGCNEVNCLALDDYMQKIEKNMFNESKFHKSEYNKNLRGRIYKAKKIRVKNFNFNNIFTNE